MPDPCKKIDLAAGNESDALLEACIKELSDGDINAMGPLYDMTKDSVYAYSLSLLKNSAEAEDAMHDCYIRINSSAGSYKPHGKPMA